MIELKNERQADIKIVLHPVMTFITLHHHKWRDSQCLQDSVFDFSHRTPRFHSPNKRNTI